MDAETLRTNPSEELQEFLGVARQHSALSESTVRKDFPCEDGSVLHVMSHAGGDLTWEITPPPTEEQQ